MVDAYSSTTVLVTFLHLFTYSSAIKATFKMLNIVEDEEEKLWEGGSIHAPQQSKEQI